MDLFQYLKELRYGHVHVHSHAASGLQAIVALHSVRLGPAIGGTRCLPYPDTESALRDAIRLGRGMSYKAAVAGLNHGGGKAVILVPPAGFHREAAFVEFGKFVDSLGGRYITCEDSGTSTSDMDIVSKQTRHVLGTSRGSGDPSPFTAYGVRRGVEAAVKFQLGRSDLSGLHIAVQGLGHVGYWFAKEVHDLGARLTVADVNQANVDRVVREFGATGVSPEEILAVECDVLSPCALGAILNDATIPKLRCRVVAGAANNQLAEDRHGIELFKRGILYSPDYAINSGGLINVATEYGGYDAAKSRDLCTRVYDTMLTIFDRARREDRPTHMVADQLAEERIFG